MRLTKIVLGCTLLVFASTGLAKKGGNGEGKPGGEDPPAATSCADRESEFPSFAYSVVDARRKSVDSKIYLSNAAGDCSVEVYSSTTEVESLSYRLVDDEVIVAWVEHTDTSYRSRDSRSEHDSIKMLRLGVANQGITSLTAADTISNSGDPSLIYASLDLSADGDAIVVLLDDATVNGIYTQSFLEFDNVSCSGGCLGKTVHIPSPDEGIGSLGYGSGGNRIYYTGAFGNAPYFGQAFISFIEKDENGSFIGPRLLTVEGNGFYVDDYSASVTMWQLDVGSADFGDGMTEAVAYRYFNVEADRDEVHVIDVGTCEVSPSSDDCLSRDDSTLMIPINDGEFPSISGNSLLFSSSSSNDIFNYNLSSEALSVVANGTEADID